MNLKYLFEIIEGDQWMGFEFGTVKNFIYFGVDYHLVVLLLKNKIDGVFLLRASIA